MILLIVVLEVWSLRRTLSCHVTPLTCSDPCPCCVSGQDSVPAGGEERSGEPEERPGQKNKNVRIRFKTGKVRTHSHLSSAFIPSPPIIHRPSSIQHVDVFLVIHNCRFLQCWGTESVVSSFSALFTDDVKGQDFHGVRRSFPPNMAADLTVR